VPSPKIEEIIYEDYGGKFVNGEFVMVDEVQEVDAEDGTEQSSMDSKRVSVQGK